MNKQQKILVCVAWPYVNGKLHVGHLAGYLIPADIFARFNRLKGNKVVMVSGADCHGTPITVEADKLKLPPEQVVDKYYPQHLDLFKKANIQFDLYTKTTTDNHKKVVQDILVSLINKGLIFKNKTKQYYSETKKMFLPDRYVVGVCPFCKNSESKGDQCDICGKIILPEQMINPKSKLEGAPVTLKETEHYFIDWPQLKVFHKKYINDKQGIWKQWITNTAVNWLNEGLKPTPITRDISWGIEIPQLGVPEKYLLKDSESKRIYVWFEAVIGYLSATIEWAKNENCDWKEFWFNSEASHWYFMGKDNLVFHALFWPGQLYSYNPKMHLPDVLSINQFLNFKGEKFSKSKGKIIDSVYLIDKYGVDQVRFYISTIFPEMSDASFSWIDFKEKVNGVLVSTIGNLFSRVLNLIKNPDFDNIIISVEVVKNIEKYKELVFSNLDKGYFKNYSDNIISLSDYGNKFIDSCKPWLFKDELVRFNQIMADCLYIIFALDLLMKPLLPGASERFEGLVIGSQLTKWPANFEEYLTSLVRQYKYKKYFPPLFSKVDEDQINRELIED